MTTITELTQDDIILQERVAIQMNREDDRTSENFVSQSKNKVVTEPVPGNMYIALEDGSLIPVNATNITVVSSPEKIPNQNFLTQQASTSGTDDNSKELPIKITNSMSLSSKYVKETILAQKGKSIKVSTSNKRSIVEEEKPGLRPNSEEKLNDFDEINAKQQSEIKHLLGPNKKMKISDPDSIPKKKLVVANKEVQDHEIQSDDTTDNEENLLADNASLTGSIEDEYTTPEYLYDELLEDENVDDDSIIAQDEDVDDSENEYSRLASSVFDTDIDEISNEDDELGCEITSKPNKSQATELSACMNKSNKSEGMLKPHFKTKTQLLSKMSSKTPMSNLQRTFSTKPSSTKFITTTSKIVTPKINDKFPDLPVPTNINQYGDCLKTRLGRYHYGLTLSDPPCQFFQGVLKGATGQTLAAMFGDINLISKFEGLPMDDLCHFAIDTTFRVIPVSTTGVNHVMAINLLFNNQTYPLWYAITSCSSTELYKRILIEFQQHVLDWQFKSVLLNNDPALCKAVLAVFPDIDLYGSWFYYCQNIWKELALHNLIDRCKTDMILMMGVKLLMVIPYLPPVSDTPSSITMAEGFEFVKQYARKNNLPKEFHKVLDYVAAFWFNIVTTKNFTVFGKQTNALNFVEIFQLSLLSYMKPNGNIWNLTHSFQSVARSASSDFDRYLQGKPPLLKKNRGKKFNVPIRQNMKRLMMGTYNVKTFLEKSTLYCEEMLDIFLHPLYPYKTSERTNYIHTEGWKIKIIDT